MEFLIFGFTFISILPFIFLVTFVLKEYGFKKRYSSYSNWKTFLFVILFSSVFSLFFSWRSVYPSNNELITFFEKTTNTNFPSTAEITSKKDNSGFNDSHRVFTFKIKKLEEYIELKEKINTSNFEPCNDCYTTKKYDKFYYLIKNNFRYNIHFLDQENEVTYEIIN